MNIDLSYDYGSGLEAPKEYDPEKPHYPFITVNDDDIELPDEGTITVQYRKVREVTTNEDGKEKYSCTLDLIAIKDVKDGAVPKPYKSRDKAGDALDLIAEGLMKARQDDPKDESKGGY
jgi:hypothetical protein